MIEKEQLRNSLVILTVLVVLFSLITGISYLLKPTITGLVTVKEQLDYSDVVNLEFTESGTYVWNLQNPGDLKSIKIDGSKTKQGVAKVYIEKDNIRYLIFDSEQLVEKPSGIFGITGLVVGELNNTLNETINKTINEVGINETLVNDSVEINKTTVTNETIKINESVVNKTIINETVEINETANQTIENKTANIILEYKTGTNWDIDNNGIENLDGVIDFTVENSEFNWNADESKLCTRWETYSEEQEESTFICHGSLECCNFIELQPTLDEWNNPFELYKGRFYNSNQYVVSAQLVYVDIDLENLQYDIVYSEPAILPAVFEEELVLFEDICIDTCSVSKFNENSYNLVVVIENATLKIDKIKYTIEKKVAKPKENIICKEFQDNVLWSSGYSIVPEGSIYYHTWNIGTNCTEAGGYNCFLQNINVSTRYIHADLDESNSSREGYVQISEPDESICNAPEQGIYSKYLAYETLTGEDIRKGWYCGKNKNPNARCAFEVSNNYDYNVNCYGIKTYGSQYFLLDVFEVSYTWCWDVTQSSKRGKG